MCATRKDRPTAPVTGNPRQRGSTSIEWALLTGLIVLALLGGASVSLKQFETSMQRAARALGKATATVNLRTSSDATQGTAATAVERPVSVTRH